MGWHTVALHLFILGMKIMTIVMCVRWGEVKAYRVLLNTSEVGSVARR